MISIEPGHIEKDFKIYKNIKYIRFILPIFGLIIVLGAIILGLSIITLVKVNNKVDRIIDKHHESTSNAKARQQSLNSILSESVRIEDAMSHLNELQRIAKVSNGTRAINTSGFNATLDYITNYLTANTNYKVTKSFFFLRDFALANNPVLISSVNGITKNYTYSTQISVADFYHAVYSTSINTNEFTQLTAIPNVGCSDDDWQKANPSPAGRVALVKRGTCPFREKIALATKYNVKAVLLYNDGTSPDRVSPIEITLAQENSMPTLFLSFTVGQALLNSTQNTRSNTRMKLLIEAKNIPDYPVGNICADTPSGMLKILISDYQKQNEEKMYPIVQELVKAQRELREVKGQLKNLQSHDTISSSSSSDNCDSDVSTISLFVQYNGFFNQLLDIQQTMTIENLLVKIRQLTGISNDRSIRLRVLSEDGLNTIFLIDKELNRTIESYNNCLKARMILNIEDSDDDDDREKYLKWSKSTSSSSERTYSFDESDV
ncbi:unnamed protein product [Adineta steineri]|uniref:PA domain-containing protein n=3 Tax=Adineta steineri TaxID=433720 RepID=A0A813N832_9BILA|nr:unnamed protein product [Adineta steineri]